MQNISPFIYNANPARVVFGSGTITRLGAELERLGIKRALLVAAPHVKELAVALAATHQERIAASFPHAEMHTPVAVTGRAMAIVRELNIDGVVAIGGGSAIGLAKAIALRTDLPQIVIPTTYAGSEMTSILGETDNGLKTTTTNPRILPEVVIYDVDLTLELPASLTVSSGMNAIAHAVEALYAHEGNPIVSMLAESAIGALAKALPVLVEDPSSQPGRSLALYGAWLCGTCLGSVGMALHHKLCHTLGGTFELPHAETHTIVLPHAVAYNTSAAPQAMVAICRALGVQDAAMGLYDLARNLGATMGLEDLGMPVDGIDRAVELVMTNVYSNPRPLERAAIHALLERAWRGDPPSH